MTQALGGWTAEGSVAGALGYLGLLGLVGLLERVQYRLKADEGRAWWASNGRDLINGMSLAAIGLSLWLNGLPGPSALVVAATLLLGIILFERVLLRRQGLAHPVLLALLFALAIAAPLLLDAAAVHAAMSRVAAHLTP